MPKIVTKIIDDAIRVRKVKAYPISPNGKQILIKTSGGKGSGDKKFEPTYDNDCVIKEDRPWYSPKYWLVGKSYEYVMVKPFAKACISFKEEHPEILGLNQAAIDEAAERKILEKLGKEPGNNTLLYMNIAMTGILLILMFAGRL